ncbi:hypothetical protein FACS189435_0670 [Bacteroidia bacterium]|nr:hypothetical protein FACS189435_0670 [Bacteroidia bacterium]
MDNTKEKIVEIAWFPFEASALTLVAFLESEDIKCCLQKDLPGFGEGVGGVKVLTLESNRPRALELMKEGGYESA